MRRLIPIIESHLHFHLHVPSARVEFSQEESGFSLHIHHSGNDYVLHTQRDEVRFFKSLTRASDFLQARGVATFTVSLMTARASNPSAKPSPNTTGEQSSPDDDRQSGSASAQSSPRAPSRQSLIQPVPSQLSPSELEEVMNRDLSEYADEIAKAFGDLSGPDAWEEFVLGSSTEEATKMVGAGASLQEHEGHEQGGSPS